MSCYGVVWYDMDAGMQPYVCWAAVFWRPDSTDPAAVFPIFGHVEWLKFSAMFHDVLCICHHKIEWCGKLDHESTACGCCLQRIYGHWKLFIITQKGQGKEQHIFCHVQMNENVQHPLLAPSFNGPNFPKTTPGARYSAAAAGDTSCASVKVPPMADQKPFLAFHLTYILAI